MFELWKLQRERKLILSRRFTSTTDDGGRFAYESDEFDKRRRRDLSSIDQRIAEFMSERLVRQAVKYDIEIPSVDPPDEYLDFDQTPAFRSELRKRIDEEQTRRREAMAWWWKNVLIPAVTALTGLGGVITGLIAVIQSKK
jgi:hypothetical protein